MKIITYFHHRQFSKYQESELYREMPDIPQPFPINPSDLLREIKTGKYADLVQQLRQLYFIDREAYKKEKQKLPCFTPSGCFSGQSLQNLISPSDLLIVDYDGIPDLATLKKVRMELESDQYTYSCWLSPSGMGLKVLVQLEDDTDNTIHHEYYTAFKEYIQASLCHAAQYLDLSGSDITRLCFVSYDPDLYTNENSSVWKDKVIPTTSHPVSLCSQSVRQIGSVQPQTITEENAKIIRFLEGNWNTNLPMTPGHRHDSSFKRAREMAEWGISIEEAYTYFDQFLSDASNPNDIIRQVDNAYAKAISGTKRRKL